MIIVILTEKQEFSLFHRSNSYALPLNKPNIEQILHSLIYIGTPNVNQKTQKLAYFLFSYIRDNNTKKQLI